MAVHLFHTDPDCYEHGDVARKKDVKLGTLRTEILEAEDLEQLRHCLLEVLDLIEQ